MRTLYPGSSCSPVAGPLRRAVRGGLSLQVAEGAAHRTKHNLVHPLSFDSFARAFFASSSCAIAHSLTPACFFLGVC